MRHDGKYEEERVDIKSIPIRNTSSAVARQQ
jgi:hypothetical protein